jgi:sugar lactone lactonase YvrE
MRKVLDDVFIPNTFLWSEDGAQFVTADSYRSIISRYTFDAELGTVGVARRIADTTADGCEPDGSASDAEGAFWNAQWNGSRVVRYTLDGAISAIVPLPARRPTSCCFGGAEHRTLFITTATAGMSNEELDRYPLSGSVLSLDIGVNGPKSRRVPGIGLDGLLIPY